MTTEESQLRYKGQALRPQNEQFLCSPLAKASIANQPLFHNCEVPQALYTLHDNNVMMLKTKQNFGAILMLSINTLYLLEPF